MMDMVKKHTVPNTDSWRTICPMLERAQEMLQMTQDATRNFVRRFTRIQFYHTDLIRYFLPMRRRLLHLDRLRQQVTNIAKLPKKLVPLGTPPELRESSPSSIQLISKMSLLKPRMSKIVLQQRLKLRIREQPIAQMFQNMTNVFYQLL